jgi:hypothetical protein
MTERGGDYLMVDEWISANVIPKEGRKIWVRANRTRIILACAAILGALLLILLMTSRF